VNGGAARPSAASPEFSLGLAGSVVLSRYRVNAVSTVNRDVVIYGAEDVRHGRPIALKVLRDDVARDSKFTDAVRSQAGVLAAAGHVLRGVQRVHDCGVTDSGQLFVALEWVEGATLRGVLDAGGALDVSTALRIAVRVGEALEALHHHRIVHGELGPDSVLMVTDGERIRIVGTELTAAYRTPLGLRLRDELSLVYRAPEQLERGETTEASDVYALGVLLRQLLTAGRSGPAGSVFAAPPMAPAIQRIIATALETRPVHRYPHVSEMVNDIWGATAVLAEPESRPRAVKARGNARRRVRRRRPPLSRPITAAVATAGVVAAVVWIVGFDALERVITRFQSRVTPPPVTAVPVDRTVVQTPGTAAPEPTTDEGAPTPSEGDADTHRSTPPPAPRAVTDEASQRPEPRAATAPAPAIVRPAPVAPAVSARARPTVGSRRPAEPSAPAESQAPVDRKSRAERTAQTERNGPDAADGSAAVDWLLNDRR